MSKMEVSGTKDSKDCLGDVVPTKVDDSSAILVAGHDRSIDISRFSPISSIEKCKPPGGKLVSTVAEKLWDGSLQLNSSITVSAVAFFKSGEKMPDLKWSDLVEVKGKVKLEAFEKYIQDLPRSRNKRLMVVSLCCKDRSSISGLAGLKEVAKGYRKGKRVGLAQLSPGTDVYICPHSDKIITILAKHGFFKGMASIQDTPDSLIGCVVWRRNCIPSNCIAKKFDKKTFSLEQPPTSHSEQKVEGKEKDLPHTEPAQESINRHGNAGISRKENKDVESSQVQPVLENSSANALLTTPYFSNSSSISAGLQTPLCSNSVYICSSTRQSSEKEMPFVDSSRVEKPISSVGFKDPKCLSSVVIRKHVPAIDEDDLPEYDFGESSGISLTPVTKPLNAVIDMNLPALKKMGGSLPLSACNKRSMEEINLPKLSLNAILSLHPVKKVCESGQTMGFPVFERKDSIQGSITDTPVSTTRVHQRKNFFDDDDDMPEWCPPDVGLCKQSYPETTNSVRTFISSAPLSKSTFGSSSSAPSFPSRAAQSSPSTKASAYMNHCPITISVKPAESRQTERYVQQDPGSFSQFNSRLRLRPPSDARLSVHPPGWKGWRK